MFAIDWRKSILMQKYKIKMSDYAAEDLENAGDYIQNILLNPTAAINTVRGIRKAANQLTEFPEAHELDEDPLLASLGVRKIYYKEYKLYYVIDEEEHTVTIVRILHMLVDSTRWLYRTFGIIK